MTYYRRQDYDFEFIERYKKAIQSIQERKLKITYYFISKKITRQMYDDAIEKLNKELEFANYIFDKKMKSG